jgi:spermidine synthase
MDRLMDAHINLKRIPAQLPGVLLLGAVSQIGQVLFLRELLMVFYGSELSIGIILAAWLVWVGLGSRLGGMIINKVKEPRKVLVFTSLGIALLIPWVMLTMRTSRAFFNVLPGAYLSLWDMTRVSFLLMALPCLLLGMQFVLLARSWRENDQRGDTSSAAKTYLTEAVGNILGGLAFTFLMVRNLSALQSALILAVLISAAMLPIIWPVSRERKYPRWLHIGLFVIVVMILPFASRLDNWAYQKQWARFSPQHQLIETHQSKHGTVSILLREGQYSFFQSGHLVFSSAGPEARDAGLENVDAVQYAHFAMVQHANPQQVLLIGGGFRGVLDEILRHPIQRLDYIELDEVLTAAVKPFIPAPTLSALDDPRVSLRHTDGRLFVKTAQETYDLVILDLPDPATAVLNRFYTIEFFHEVKSILTTGGVFVLGVSTTPDMRGLAIANRNKTLYHSLSSVFAHVAAASDQNLVLISTDSPDATSLDPAILTERYLDREIGPSLFSPEHFHTILQEAHIRRVSWTLNTHGREADAHREGPGPVPLIIPDLDEQARLAEESPAVRDRFFLNSDLKPIGYFYTVMFLEHLTRAGQTETLTSLLNVQPWWIISLLALPVLLIVGLRLGSREEIKPKIRQMVVLFSVFSAGFAVMVLQISLIFAFQSIYGFIFEVIGVITALFMCGLAFGTYLSHRCNRVKHHHDTLILIQVLMGGFAGLMAIGLPAVLTLHTSVFTLILFAVLLFIAGLLNGLNYPIAAAGLQHINQQADQSSGFVYSSELIGACLGAVLASVLIAPMWGIVACCLLAASANGSAILTLFLSRRTR